MKKTPSLPVQPSLTNEQARLKASNLQTQAATAEALRASEERFARFFHLSPFRMGILRIRDGIVLEVNDTWIRETGFSRREVINESIFKFSSSMGDGLADRIRQVLKTPKPILNLDVRFKSKD